MGRMRRTRRGSGGTGGRSGKRAAIGATLAGIAAVGCTTIEIAAYRSDCYLVTAAAVELDCDDDTWSFSGLCVTKRHGACPDISRFVFEAGIDRNDNGQLDDGEEILSVDDMHPGERACVGAASGETGGGKHDLVYHYEVYVEGQAEPVVSKSEAASA